MRPLVKICGIMNTHDVHMCARHGADIVGFVVDYPHPVPWNINLELAKELVAATPQSTKTCIVTGGPPDKILRIAAEVKPGYIQLHNDESLEDTVLLVRELEKHGIKIIKTIFPNTPNLEKSAAEFCTAGIYALLYDQRTPDNAVDSGAADLPTFMRLKGTVSCPVILAGGITPENVADIISRTGAQVIDIMTGVERRYGIKDEERVSSLFRAIRGE